MTKNKIVVAVVAPVVVLVAVFTYAQASGSDDSAWCEDLWNAGTYPEWAGDQQQFTSDCVGLLESGFTRAMVEDSYAPVSDEPEQDADRSMTDNAWCESIWGNEVYPAGWERSDFITDCTDALDAGYTRDQVLSIYEGMPQG